LSAKIKGWIYQDEYPSLHPLPFFDFFPLPAEPNIPLKRLIISKFVIFVKEILGNSWSLSPRRDLAANLGFF